MIALDPGKMRTKIEIQQRTLTNTNGSEEETWATTITTVAKKETSSSREFWAAQKTNAEVTAIYIIRYRSAITSTMRVKDDSRYYDIIGINNVDDANKWLIISAKEVV